MRLHNLAASLALLASSAAAGTLASRASSTCTLSASGGDDAPAFLAAAKDTSCPTVAIPQGTTLNIASRMNMTGIQNKHIVSTAPSDVDVHENLRRIQESGRNGAVHA